MTKNMVQEIKASAHQCATLRFIFLVVIAFIFRHLLLKADNICKKILNFIKFWEHYPLVSLRTFLQSIAVELLGARMVLHVHVDLDVRAFCKETQASLTQASVLFTALSQVRHIGISRLRLHSFEPQTNAQILMLKVKVG